jgi:hypothetical protein
LSPKHITGVSLSTGKRINGLAFKFIPEAQWKEFGVSPGGLIILREHIMKQVGVEKVIPDRNTSFILQHQLNSFTGISTHTYKGL